MLSRLFVGTVVCPCVVVFFGSKNRQVLKIWCLVVSVVRLRFGKCPMISRVLMMNRDPDFFDLTAVRRLTLEVERTRKLMQAAARSYALADEALPAELDALYQVERAAHLEACLALVNALHDYWPEFFGHDVPF